MKGKSFLNVLRYCNFLNVAEIVGEVDKRGVAICDFLLNGYSRVSFPAARSVEND
jgi:hypothetical protein